MSWTPRVLIAFYSRNCPTEGLANAIAEGARAEGAVVRLRRARERVGAEGANAMTARYEAPTQADAEWADAIVFGTPTRFGSISPELKAYVDGLGGLWFQDRINGKVGSAFASTSDEHGDNQPSLLPIYTPLAHLGLMIVRLGYADTALFRAERPHAAAHVSDLEVVQPDAGHMAIARSHGQRVASAAHAMRRAHCGRDRKARVTGKPFMPTHSNSDPHPAGRLKTASDSTPAVHP